MGIGTNEEGTGEEEKEEEEIKTVSPHRFWCGVLFYW